MFERVSEFDEGRLRRNDHVRSKILAIATELENIKVSPKQATVGGGGGMTTIPDDYARCHGTNLRYDLGYGEFPEDTALAGHPQCRDCLRRTAPMRDNVLYSYFAPPEFTTTCPERIAP
jgi:hypothetical protein